MILVDGNKKEISAIFDNEEGKIIHSKVIELLGDGAHEPEVVEKTQELVEAVVQLVLKKVFEANSYLLNIIKSGTYADIDDVLAASSEPSRERVSFIKQTSPVFPAIIYIEKHKREEITMKSMAQFCHLSPSYFSKLFYKETGENFTDYINRRKVEWACERLSGTTDSITKIALDLGFQDASYFIKVFKKYSKTTPGLYRKANMS